MMAKPDGTLTSAQLEILEAVWDGPTVGSTVTEIWQSITRHRDLTRTTVLNQVDRLEKRRWLRRKKHDDGFRYLATFDRDEANRSLAEQFVNEFFGGSAGNLVMSLLGSKKLKPAELQRLRDLLQTETSDEKSK